MHTEAEPRPGLKTKIFKRLKGFGIFSRVPPETHSTEISLPQEEMGNLMYGMDMLKLQDGFLPEEEDGRVNYWLSLKQKELQGLSGVFREFMMLGVRGMVKIGFSYDQKDFGVVRRIVSLKHGGRKLELVVRPDEARCELSMEHPAGSGLPLSEENKTLLASDLSVVIRAGLNGFSVNRPGSS